MVCTHHEFRRAVEGCQVCADHPADGSRLGKGHVVAEQGKVVVSPDSERLCEGMKGQCWQKGSGVLCVLSCWMGKEASLALPPPPWCAPAFCANSINE